MEGRTKASPFPLFQSPWCHRRRLFGIVSNGPRKMASILGDGTDPGGSGPSRCLLLLQRSLAIQLTRGPPPQVLNASQRESPKEHPADEMWMYDKGYNLFQVSRQLMIPRLLVEEIFLSYFLLSYSRNEEVVTYFDFDKRQSKWRFDAFYLIRIIVWSWISGGNSDDNVYSCS